MIRKNYQDITNKGLVANFYLTPFNVQVQLTEGSDPPTITIFN